MTTEAFTPIEKNWQRFETIFTLHRWGGPFLHIEAVVNLDGRLLMSFEEHCNESVLPEIFLKFLKRIHTSVIPFVTQEN